MSEYDEMLWGKESRETDSVRIEPIRVDVLYNELNEERKLMNDVDDLNILGDVKSVNLRRAFSRTDGGELIPLIGSLEPEQTGESDVRSQISLLTDSLIVSQQDESKISKGEDADYEDNDVISQIMGHFSSLQPEGISEEKVNVREETPLPLEIENSDDDLGELLPMTTQSSVGENERDTVVITRVVEVPVKRKRERQNKRDKQDKEINEKVIKENKKQRTKKHQSSNTTIESISLISSEDEGVNNSESIEVGEKKEMFVTLKNGASIKMAEVAGKDVHKVEVSEKEEPTPKFEAIATPSEKKISAKPRKPSSLASIISKTQTTRPYRVGLSKRQRLEPLHGYLRK